VARRSLKPQLNQIRTWVRQGRTDAWIAHQLEVTVRDLGAFKREHELAPADDGDDAAAQGPAVDHERDLREEDDALVAAELDAMSEDLEEEVSGAEEDEDADGADADGAEQKPRRRGRRGGRRRRGGARARPKALEGTFDHGEEGYGLWLDPALQDDPIYAEHWAGHRPVTVSVEPDRIIIRRGGEEQDAEESAGDAEAPTGDAEPVAGAAEAPAEEASTAAPDPDEFAA